MSGDPKIADSHSDGVIAADDDRRSAEALRESERKYRALFESEADAIFLINRSNGQILDVNGAASRLYGYSRDELLTMKNTDVSAEPDRTRQATQADAAHVPTRYHRRKDGTVFPVEITATAIRLGGNDVHVVAIRDITERHHFEEALRRSEEKYRELVENANSIILRLDTRGTITFLNEFGQRFFGYSEAELLGKRAATTFVSSADPSGESRIKMVEDILNHPERYGVNENENLRRDGTAAWISWTNRPIVAESGEVVGVLCVGTDITDRRRAEEALREAHQAEHRRREESERRRLIAEALRGILAVLNSNRPHSQILNHIVGEACRLLGTSTGAIYRLEDGNRLQMHASLGLPTDHAASLPSPIADGYIAQAIRERQPLAISDLARTIGTDGSRFGAPIRGYLAGLLSRFGALLVVPLTVKDEIYGGIALYYPTARDISAEEVELAMAFADEAALAIENARLRARAEEAAVAAERNRLARDLHDAVTQTLFSASLIAEVLPRLWARNQDEGRRRLEELRELTRGALAEMRTLLLELRPTVLNEASLPSLLQQLAEATTGRARIPATLAVDGQLGLPADVKVALYRIAQEALNNVVKHSGAGRVDLSLVCRAGSAELTIRDDGRGFDVGSIPPTHLGLGIMYERAQSIGAELSITSRQPVGTAVVATWKPRAN